MSENGKMNKPSPPRNTVFQHKDLGKLELKYVSLGDLERFEEFLRESDPRRFVCLVVHNQLLTPKATLSEIEGWPDEALQEVCMKLAESESSIAKHLVRVAEHNYFQDFRESVRRYSEDLSKTLDNAISQLRASWGGLGAQMALAADAQKQLNLALSKYDFSLVYGNLSTLARRSTESLQLSLRALPSTDPWRFETPEPPRPLAKRTTEEALPETVSSFPIIVDPALERRRRGAWQALRGTGEDKCAQAAHSMREVLRQLLESLAPEPDVLKAPWYSEPANGAKVTRKMRVRYATAGYTGTVSVSTVELVEILFEAVDRVYSKLSAEAHRSDKTSESNTEACLKACEAIMLLVLANRTNQHTC